MTKKTRRPLAPRGSRPVALSGRAEKDLRSIDPVDRQRIVEGLRQLGADAPNLDVKVLRGRAPWRRLRVGDYRVLFRHAAAAEMKLLTGKSLAGYLVARIVDRGDLEQAVPGL